jgi:hypothetical protein
MKHYLVYPVGLDLVKSKSIVGILKIKNGKLRRP